MPWKRKSSRTKPSTRRPRRRAASKKKRSNAPSTYPSFPANKVVRLRYFEDITVASNTSMQSFFYRANGIFDPRVATGGHQPLGADQWELFYNHYCVLGSKATFTVTGVTNAAPLDLTLCAAYISDDVTVPSDINTIIEQGRASYKLLPAYNAMKTAKVASCYSAKKFFAVKDVADNLDRLGAAFGADPTEIAFHSFNISNISAQGTATDVTFTVLIEYTVLLSEPKDLPTS